MDIQEFAKKTNMPADAVPVLIEAYEKVKDTEEYQELVEMIIWHRPFSDIAKKAEQFAEPLGVHVYTLEMVLLCSCADMARDRYLQRGVKEDIFWATAHDIVNKLIECKEVKGIWGTFVFTWFENFYEAVIFHLGRLHFIRRKYKNGVYALDVHIPSCGPLYYEDVMKSYKLAYDFFEHTHGEYTAFRCCSWLLNPDYRGTVFKENSNTFAFAKDYVLFQHFDDPSFSECWRLFGVYYDGNPDNLPEDTSMRRAMKAYLKNGGKTGQDTGGFLFDGERILKEESEILREGLIR
ncbi:MAG: DUF5596 domain-containing protein [Clostridia bacterium]|nr:DUF5596 domain-containing protein [Clostridia bacterium]